MPNARRLVIRSHIEVVKKFCQGRNIRFKIWELKEKNKTKSQLKKEQEARKRKEEEEDIWI